MDVNLAYCKCITLMFNCEMPSLICFYLLQLQADWNNCTWTQLKLSQAKRETDFSV